MERKIAPAKVVATPEARIPYDRPLRELHELNLPARLSVPEIFLRHREHHGVPVLGDSPSRWGNDVTGWQRMPSRQRQVFVHVLTRFAFGIDAGLAALPLFEAAAKAAGRDHSLHYAAIRADSIYMRDACVAYRSKVGCVDGDRGALTTSYCRLFQEILPAKIQKMESAAALSRRQQIRAEAELRTVYHVVGEGLGAMSGIWGMNAALRKLEGGTAVTGKTIEMPGLCALLANFTLIERRNIAFGLSEMAELVREQYFTASLATAREFLSAAPVLKRMRNETFERWGKQFPFDIDKGRLASMARNRVLGWLGEQVLVRHAPIDRVRLQTLADIV